MNKYTDAELIAYLHGELNLEKVEKLEKNLQSDAKLGDRLDILDQVNEAIEGAFEHELKQQKTDELASFVKHYTEKSAPANASRIPQWVAAACMIIGVMLGFYMANSNAPVKDKNWVEIVADYQVMYWKGTLTNPTAATPDRQETEKYLQQYFDNALSIPDFSTLDLTFVRGQILKVYDKPLAQIVYLFNDQEPVALCIVKTENLPHVLEDNAGVASQLNYVTWSENQYSYVLIGRVNSEVLSQLESKMRSS